MFKKFFCYIVQIFVYASLCKSFLFLQFCSCERCRLWTGPFVLYYHLINGYCFIETSIGFTTKIQGSYSSRSSIIEGNFILFNKGNAYNGTVFTCPSPGLYLFHVSVITSSTYNGVWIYKNSQRLTLAFSGTNGQSNGASVSAATWLDTGDHVYLRPNTHSLSLDGNSAFTGVKII